ncbi:MAG: ECF transporter S component [Clostridia bacterium]|nr:ECF transporter S component [Clostridia bacterium]
MNSSTRNLTLSGMFIALGLLLPLLTGQIPEIGSKLLPMHIPVLLCGFVCGWPYGLAVGFITPLLRSLLFTMPPMMPTAVAMAFELAVYGVASALLYRLLPKKPAYLYVSLILTMILGRLVWGAAASVVFPLAGADFGMKIFYTAAVLNAIPGILLQIVIIPPILYALQRAKLLKAAPNA